MAAEDESEAMKDRKIKPRAPQTATAGDLHVVFSRVANDVYAKLQKVAERDGKSVSLYVAKLIERDVSKRRTS